MKFADSQNVLSSERLNRYVAACGNDTRKAMSLYRLNLHLSQEVFTLLSCFEVALRNAIDRQLTSRFGKDWLRDSVSIRGIFDIPSCRDSARISARLIIVFAVTVNTPIISFSPKWSSASGNICLPILSIALRGRFFSAYSRISHVHLPRYNTTMPTCSTNLMESIFCGIV